MHLVVEAAFGIASAALADLGVSQRQVDVQLRPWREGEGSCLGSAPGPLEGRRGSRKRPSAALEERIRDLLRTQGLAR